MSSGGDVEAISDADCDLFLYVSALSSYCLVLLSLPTQLPSFLTNRAKRAVTKACLATLPRASSVCPLTQTTARRVAAASPVTRTTSSRRLQRSCPCQSPATDHHPAHLGE